MPLMKERGEADTSFGQIVILAAVVADFVTMLLITVVVAFYEHAGLTLDIVIILFIFVLFGDSGWCLTSKTSISFTGLVSLPIPSGAGTRRRTLAFPGYDRLVRIPLCWSSVLPA